MEWGKHQIFARLIKTSNFGHKNLDAFYITISSVADQVTAADHQPTQTSPKLKPSTSINLQ
jgi:hypothetical protein